MRNGSAVSAAPAAKKKGVVDQPYHLAEKFEKAVAFLAGTNPGFLGRTACELDPELLRSGSCRLAVQASQNILESSGSGPTSFATITQWVARQRDMGKVSQADVDSISDLWDDALALEISPAEVEEQLVNVLRPRLRQRIALESIKEYNSSEAWETVDALRLREQRLGKGVAATVEPAFHFERSILEIKNLERIPLGIAPVDELLDGGAPRGTLTCFMAASGGGKSMALSQAAAITAQRGALVAYATLEIPKPHVVMRMVSAATGMLQSEVSACIDTPASIKRVKDQLSRRGPWDAYCSYFTPHSTTMSEVERWLREVEREARRAVDVVCIDYADLMTSSGKLDEKGLYQEMRLVYQALRTFAVDNKAVVLTASQSKAREDRKAKKLDLEHAADSSHKHRVSDQFITMNYDDETTEMSFFSAKNRFGNARDRVLRAPTNFERGLVAPVALESPEGEAPTNVIQMPF